MSLISLILATLAVYRLSHMVVVERGAFDIFVWFRSFLYNNLDPSHWVQVGFNCILCVSFWMSFLYLFLGYSLMDCIGVSGAVLVLHKVLYKYDN